jgi:hypothetical protein
MTPSVKVPGMPGQTLAGCVGMREGSCKKTTDFVRTSLCPAKEDVEQGFSSHVARFGFYNFTSVFRASTVVLDFLCSDICDGTMSFDTVECDRPYARNMATCAAEDVSDLGNMIPVCACPVIMNNEDDKNTKQLNHIDLCVQCQDCCHEQYERGRSMYRDWGGWCVCECIQLLYTSGMVWDWTTRCCITCYALSDISLCNNSDKESMSLMQHTVTGNLPLLFFVYCKGGGHNLLDIGYGRCTWCHENMHHACGGQTYPVQCENGTSVLCEASSRTTQLLYVDMLQGCWIDV